MDTKKLSRSVKNVRLIFPFDYDLGKLLPNSGEFRFGNYKFYLNDDLDRYDYLFVYHSSPPIDGLLCPSNSKILMTVEPYSIKKYNKVFINQFDHIITNQTQINHNSVFLGPNAYPWFVEKNYNFLYHNLKKPRIKDKILVVTS